MRALRRSITLVDGLAVGARGEGERHAVLEHRLGEASTSSIEGAKRPSSSARARTASISAWLARGPGPQAIGFADLAAVRARAARSAPGQDRLDHRLADRHAAHQALRRHQLVRRHRRLRLGLLGAGGGEQHAPLGLAVGIVDVDLHQEAVELRFGQRIGAFLLERVLGRQHVERLRQVVAHAGDRDMLFLHRLQQRRLGARAGAVDLVRHQQLGRTPGPGMKRKLRRPPALSSSTSEPRMSDGIRSGVNWMRLASRPEHDAQRLDQLGLGEARHADQQRMAAGTGS